MRAVVQSKLEPFLCAVSLARNAALLLDYDGTLAPFHERRDQALPYPGVISILQEIMRNGRTRLVVITGRDAMDLKTMLDIHPRPEIWGMHGLQRLGVSGTIEMPSFDEKTLNALSDADRWLNYQQLQNSAEFKPGGIAVHWRGQSDLMIENIRARVMLGWRLIAAQSGLNLLEFDGGIEIRASQANKGEAVRAFLNEIGPDSPVAYLGDDTTDESAFRAIGSRGVTVLVRPKWRRTAAQLWMKPPEDVIDFLGFWLRSCLEGSEFKGVAARAVNG